MKWLFDFIKSAGEVIAYIFTGDTGTITKPVITNPTPMPPVSPTPAAPAPLSNRERLYGLAKSCLGRDIAATQNELGCAEAVSYLLHSLRAAGFQPTLSTQELYKQLKSDLSAFESVPEPLPGDIIISPTGSSSIGSAHGHVGIVAYHGVMSNNSMSGLWDQYYTLESWKAYYEDKLKFPILYYRLK